MASDILNRLLRAITIEQDSHFQKTGKELEEFKINIAEWADAYRAMEERLKEEGRIMRSARYGAFRMPNFICRNVVVVPDNNAPSLMTSLVPKPFFGSAPPASSRRIAQAVQPSHHLARNALRPVSLT